MITLDDSTPSIQLEDSNPSNPYAQAPNLPRADSSYDSAFYASHPPGSNQPRPFSWVENSLPLSTGRVNIKNAFVKAWRKTKTGKAPIRKRSIFMVEVEEKEQGATGMDLVEVAVQVQCKKKEEFTFHKTNFIKCV